VPLASGEGVCGGAVPLPGGAVPLPGNIFYEF